MNVLVTGGTGFVGSHLVNRLIETGHEVTVLDNFSYSKNDNINKKASLVTGDIRDPDDIKKTMRDFSAVFHLAAIADARSSDEDAVYKINFIGAKNVFEAALARKAKIIFTSTSAVYGNGDVPACESSICKPLSQYGKSKLNAERWLAQQNGEYFIARLFNVYGPGARSAVNQFCRKIINYEDVPVFGNGFQTRDYVYIDDVVNALLLGISNSGIYNVGTGRDTSVMALVDMIHNTTRCKPNVVHIQNVETDVARSRADITKILQTGWAPGVQLEYGIKLVLDSLGYEKHV